MPSIKTLLIPSFISSIIIIPFRLIIVIILLFFFYLGRCCFILINLMKFIVGCIQNFPNIISVIRYGFVYIPDGDFDIEKTVGEIFRKMKINKDYNDPDYDNLFHVYLSKLMYESSDRIKQQCINWKFDKNSIEIFEDTQSDDLRTYTYSTKAVAIHYKESNQIIIAFCGIEPMDLLQWLTNASTDLINIGNLFNHLGNIINNNNEEVGVHAGFYHALGLHRFSESINIDRVNSNAPIFIKLLNFIRKFDQNDSKCKISITGHSLGGALASLFSYVLLAYGYESSIYGIYIYGSPLVGNHRYAEILKNKLGNRFNRWTNPGDIVPRIPVTQEPSFSEYYTLTAYAEILGVIPNNDQHNFEKVYSIVQGGIRAYEIEMELFNLNSKKNVTNSSFGMPRMGRFLWLIIRNGVNEHCVGEYARNVKKIIKEIYQL